MKKNGVVEFKSAFRIFALTLFLIVAIAPLYWIIVTSLKGPREIYSNPIKYFPSRITFESYKKLFSFSNFGNYFFNSVVLSVGAAFAALMISMFSGFALFSNLCHVTNARANETGSCSRFILRR